LSITKDFQAEVARKLTLLFDQYFSSIMQGQEWNNIPIEYRRIENIDQRYYSYEQFIDGFNLANNDSTNLFFAQLLAKGEVDLIRERIRCTQNRNRRGLRLEHLLECCSEPQTCYYDNDGTWIPIDHPIGNPIYSPILDIAIAPSVYMGANRQNPFISTYPLRNGPIMFEALSKITLIRRFKEEFERYTRQNYQRIGLQYQGIEINERPLCLFGIEIENSDDKKHLMGDFLNNLMLSKYPIVIVPDSKLDSCLELIKLSEVIYKLKSVNVFSLINNVMLLNVSQFRNIINIVLQEKNIELLGVQEYS